MQAPSWINLLERIPATLHDTIAITIVTGADIMLQSVLRLDGDYAIIRGRMAGSTDAGRVIILPYDQIVNLAFTKRMLQPEVREVFGDIREGAAGPSRNSTGEEDAIAEEETKPEVQNGAAGPAQQVAMPLKTKTPQSNESLPAKNQPAAPSKSLLLARLRARLAEQGK